MESTPERQVQRGIDVINGLAALLDREQTLRRRYERALSLLYAEYRKARTPERQRDIGRLSKRQNEALDAMNEQRTIIKDYCNQHGIDVPHYIRR